LHVVEHLASPQRLAAAQAGTAATSIAAITAAVAAARRAALADDAGRALDAALVQHGAPPRPLREQPMRWVTRRPGGRAGAAKSHAHEDAAA
jgi:indolepyruvate ferredoxin oxidoreductase beta subunit